MKLNNVVIFGDSYSTFLGYVPEGYPVYYWKGRTEEPDVRDVKETWWDMLITECDGTLVRNDSWSGSTICYTGYNGTDCSQSSSFIYRLQKLCDEGYWDDKDVNTVFVFGGTNDSWAGSPIGEVMYDGWTKDDLYRVLPAFCYFVKRLSEVFPSAEVVCLVNTGLNPKIADGYVSACEHYGVRCIRFDHIDKISGHPTIKGMNDIKEHIIASY